MSVFQFFFLGYENRPGKECYPNLDREDNVAFVKEKKVYQGPNNKICNFNVSFLYFQIIKIEGFRAR